MKLGNATTAQKSRKSSGVTATASFSTMSAPDMWYTQVARATGARSTPQIGYVSQARRESGFLILSV